MSSFQRLVLEYDLSANAFKGNCDLAPLGIPALQNFGNFVDGVCGGEYSGKFTFNVGATKASGTIVSTGTAGNNETCTICGVTITAKSSGAGENEFDVSATPSVQAANIAAAINESSDLAGIVTAEASSGTVTVTCVVPGLIGNGLVMADVNLANVAITSFSGGTDGTEYIINQL